MRRQIGLVALAAVSLGGNAVFATLPEGEVTRCTTAWTVRRPNMPERATSLPARPGRKKAPSCSHPARS